MQRHQASGATPLTWYQHLWTGWPIALGVAGGALGGACGGAAWAVNRKIFAKEHLGGSRYLLSGLVSVASVVCYLILVRVFLGVIRVHV
jgi:hypothetical protein